MMLGPHLFAIVLTHRKAAASALASAGVRWACCGCCCCCCCCCCIGGGGVEGGVGHVSFLVGLAVVEEEEGRVKMV